MKLLQRILIPYDSSNAALNALYEASRFKAEDSKITLLYIQTGHDQRKEKEILESIRTEIRSIYDDVEIIVKKGEPALDLNDHINNGDYSLVIMGTAKKHKSLAELIGTQSLKVIQHSNKPVLVIPENQHLRKIEKIVFATDFHKVKKLDILHHLHDLCTTFKAQLIFLNINESPERISKTQAEEALKLHQYFSDIEHEFTFSKEKDPRNGITKYVNSNGVDIVALMPRNHSFFQAFFHDSLTDDLVMHLNIPLFSFHE